MCSLTSVKIIGQYVQYKWENFAIKDLEKQPFLFRKGVTPFTGVSPNGGDTPNEVSFFKWAYLQSMELRPNRSIIRIGVTPLNGVTPLTNTENVLNKFDPTMLKRIIQEFYSSLCSKRDPFQFPEIAHHPPTELFLTDFLKKWLKQIFL